MLGSKKLGPSVSGSTTLVSSDTVIIGDVRFCGNLDIEGLVQGNIIAQPDKEALVRVVGKGRVEGEIRAPNIVINGEVEGDVYSTKQLELASKGQVQGNVYYTQVEMAAGSEVNGNLTHIAPGSPTAGDAVTSEGEPSEASSSPESKKS
jgi:cytoskeletal protein CcmA (bactofilin family)